MDALVRTHGTAWIGAGKLLTAITDSHYLFLVQLIILKIILNRIF
jgi:hypothetical protein